MIIKKKIKTVVISVKAPPARIYLASLWARKLKYKLYIKGEAH